MPLWKTATATGRDGKEAPLKGLTTNQPKSHGNGLLPEFSNPSGLPYMQQTTRVPSAASSHTSQQDLEEVERVAAQVDHVLREKFGTLKHEEEEEIQRRNLQAKKKEMEKDAQAMVETQLNDDTLPPSHARDHLRMFNEAFAQKKGQLRVSPVGLAKLMEKADEILVCKCVCVCVCVCVCLLYVCVC
jgi:hypothetical protein